MTHETAMTLLVDVLAGTATPGTRAAVADHLENHPECRGDAARIRLAHEMLRLDSQTHESVGRPVATSGPGGAAEGPRREAEAPSAWLRGPRRDLLVAGVAALLGLAGGAAITTAPTRTPTPIPGAGAPAPGTEFVVFLEENGESWPPDAPLARTGYLEWTAQLASEGHYAGGRRLAEDEGWYVRPDGTAIPAGDRAPAAHNYSGWYVIQAETYEEALELARASPHLGWGGVLVRRSYP